MTAAVRFRDIVKVPKWIDRVGRDFIGSMVAPLDTAVQHLTEGLTARFPGRGTPTALPYIGRSRGITRNQNESDEDFALRLIAWFELHPQAGWDERIARVVHEYLEDHPMVRVVDRSGQWTTIGTLGNLSRDVAAWDWDSVSHPERNDPDAPWWSDLWVIIYPTPWTLRSGTLGDLTGDDGFGLGHMCPRADVYALKGLLSQWKAAHARIRAVIWTSDVSLFDPGWPAGLPDGTWGAWGGTGSGSRTLSGRNLTSCRYWEPR